ncbi:MAG TPA: tetratricopeptide repeat protein [Polyangia bacterium]|nr:tetratricopeptide repeat protein [Polyangia bacterium]
MNTSPRTLVLLSLFLATPSRASAQTVADRDPELLILRGLDLRRAGRSEEALILFRRAYELAPSPRTLGQMGLVESSLQLWIDADAHLTAVLATPDDTWVHRNRPFLDRAMARTQEHVGELSVSGPPGARISVGGRPLGSLPLAPVRLVEGDLTLSATSEGKKPYRVDVSIKGGARAAITIVLEPIDLAARDHEVPPAVALARPPARMRARVGGALAAAGLVALAWGVAWIALDGRPSCDGCGSNYDTRTAGIVLAGGGSALALVGGALLFAASHTAAPAPATIGLEPRSVSLGAPF